MKNRIFNFFSLLLIAAPAHSGFKNEPDGFRGIHWGDTIQSLEAKFVHISGRGDYKTYERKNDKLAIGKVPLSKVTYRFFEGRFIEAEISTPQPCSRFKEIVFTKFGEPKLELIFYQWQGRKTGMVLKLFEDQCEMRFFSIENSRRKAKLKKLEEAKEKAPLIKAGEDF